MINLINSSTDKLQVTSSAAGTLDIVVSWVDLASNGSGDPTPGRTVTAMTTATTSDIVATPATSTVRNVKDVTIRNKHASLTTNVTVLYNANGTTYTLTPDFPLAAGEAVEYHEGIGWFELSAATLPMIGRVLTADDAGGTNGTGVQPWFPTNGALAVSAATTYWMRGLLKMTSGATTHTTAVALGGTATLTSVDYYAQMHRSAADTIVSVFSGIHVASASAAITDVTGVQVGHYLQVNGTIRINAAGTLIPQFQFSGAPGTPITVKRNSFFWLQAVGDNAADKLGTWT